MGRRKLGDYMLSDEVIDKVVRRLTKRIEEGNTFVLEEIGKSIKKIGTLSPSKANQLAQTLKYGGDFDKIVKRLQKITDLNVKDIYKIFDEVAKNDLNFAKQFYDYRGAKFIPYEENGELKRQVQALAEITANEYMNLTNTKAIGFSIRDVKNNIIFKDLSSTYMDVIDTAVMNISQGKETFNKEMSRIIKELGASGIKKIEYESGYSLRLDSAVTMQMNSALTQLHDKTQEIFGREFKSDGVEISVHINPAPDHEKVQGKQFSTNKYDEEGNVIKEGEYEKLQNDKDAVSYDGVKFPAIADETGHDRRAIGQYNCRHYTFRIVLGVSEPEYSNEQLQKIIDDNNEGFEYNGKHYTNYEGTQIQRQLEAEIRKQKDIQIIAKASGLEDELRDSQLKINQLTQRYNEFSKISGLPTVKERLTVSGYRKAKIQ